MVEDVSTTSYRVYVQIVFVLDGGTYSCAVSESAGMSIRWF
jgi:hypothetical protein